MLQSSSKTDLGATPPTGAPEATPGVAAGLPGAAARAVLPKPGMRSTFIGAACISLQPILLSALMLPVTAYVIRGLGPTAYGQWAIATTLTAVVVFVTNPGLRGAFVRSVARDPESAAGALAEQLGARIALSFVAAIIAVGVSLVLRYPKVVVLCTAVSSVGLVLLTVSTTGSDLLQALQRLPTVAMVNMAAGLVLTVASVVATFLDLGPVGVAVAYLVGPTTSIALFLWLIHRQHFPVRVRWDLGGAFRLVWNARHIASQQLVWSAAHNAEALMIPGMVGPKVFGYFSAGALLSQRLGAIPEGLCSAAYPAMVAAYRDGARPALRVFFKFLFVVLITSIAGAVCTNFIAGPIARLLFKEQAEICEQVMRITIWVLPSMGAHFCLGYLLNAMDRDAAQAKLSLVASVINLGITAVLVLRFGIIGACWSMVLRYIVHLLFQVPYVVWAFRRLLAQDKLPTDAASVLPVV
jgi:O-antigen/teichoic acid export membrane protein